MKHQEEKIEGITIHHISYTETTRSSTVNNVRNNIPARKMSQSKCNNDNIHTRNNNNKVLRRIFFD